MFVILSVGGLIYRRMHRKKEQKRRQIARSQAEMVKFDERQKRRAEMAASREIAAWIGESIREPEGPKKQPVVAANPVDEVQSVS